MSFKQKVIKAVSKLPFLGQGLIAVKKSGELFDLDKKINNCSNAQVKSWLKEVKENGFCVIENFYSEQECDELVAEIEKAQNDNPSFVQIDAEGSDHRLFGAENASNAINSKFHNEPRINLASKIYYGADTSNAFTLAAKMVYKPNAKGSGGGWHRDAYLRQIKAIAYLSDVTTKNGPFQYIKGSHSLTNMMRQTKHLKHTVQNVRQTDEEIDRLINNNLAEVVEFVAKKGTVILTDTSGLHRGKPIEEGARYALTNYFVSNKIVKKGEFLKRFEPVLKAKN